MVSVEEAIKLVEYNTKPLEAISLELSSCLGHVLSEDVIAPISLPPFEQSAMDGYAIAHSQKDETSNRFKLIGELKAGDSCNFELQRGEAVRIFTGAMVPKGTTSVIMQEVTKVIEDTVDIQQDIVRGSNIRPIGEQIQKGETALSAGTLLNPAGIGFLSSLGISDVEVFRKPKVGLLVTGNELVKLGSVLKAGQIYESNSYMLIAALKQAGIEVYQAKSVQDNLKETVQSVKEYITSVDVLILSGGISVGDYDFVGQALEILNVEKLFYKVRQKPGKPLFFGKKANCRIFALPGNPSASLSCFYHYVLPSIRLMSGISPHVLERRELKLANDYIKKGDRAHFLKAKVVGEKVEVLDGQSSAMLHTFAEANALIYLPSDKSETKKGEKVVVYMLPFF